MGRRPSSNASRCSRRPLDRAREALGEALDLSRELGRVEDLEVNADRCDIDRQAAEPVGTDVQQAGVLVEGVQRAGGRRDTGATAASGACRSTRA